MTREFYDQRREQLLAEAQQLLDESKNDEFDAKTKEIEALDEQFEADAKKQANLDAMRGRAVGSMANAAVPGAGRLLASMNALTADADIYDTAEYKTAFMNYVLRNTPIPAQFRNADNDGPTKTTDVEVMIPTVTLQKIIERMDQMGNFLRIVTQTNIKAGVSIPVAGLKPVASWVAEGAGSQKQKLGTTAITFGAYKLRCAVSLTFEVDHMAYPIFERYYVKAVSEAMVKAKETAIFSGSGSGQPKGILKETPEATVEIAAANAITYADLLAMEAEQVDPSAVWAMTKKTYIQHIMGILDDNGQPVARVNVGIDGKPEYMILGRRVEIASPDYMDDYAASVEADTVVALMYNFSDYVINSPVPMTTKKYYDEDVDDTVLKAIELCDGKSTQNQSLVFMTKKTNP